MTQWTKSNTEVNACGIFAYSNVPDTEMLEADGDTQTQST